MTRNRIPFVTLASLMLALGLSVTANAQYLTSAKAGFVNRVEGKVHILRIDSEDGEKGRASLGTQMRDGDRISSTANSFAEVLLNPGSYLRLSENTEVRAINTNLSSVRFELIKGSVIAEVGEANKQAPIEILTPQGTLTIAKDGLQRIDARESATLVLVRQGEIYLGTREEFAAKKAMKIGRGKVASLTGAPAPELAKLDKDKIDSFDVWSFSRAQTLTAANVASLRRGRVMTAFAGGWYYDPFFNCYTFMPYRSRFYSPYGFGFFNNFYDCYYYNPYYWYGNRGGGYGGGGGGSVNTPPARVVTGVDRAPIRREAEGRSIDTSSTFDSRSGGFGDFGGSRTISSPSSSSSSSSTISAPAPSRSESGGGGGRSSLPSRP